LSGRHPANPGTESLLTVTADVTTIPTTASPACLLPALRARWEAMAGELGKFLAVGGVAFIVDMLIFNLLRQSGSSSVAAKALSTIIATLVAYLGNRYWSFSHRAGEHIRNETAIFFALNGVGLVISLACVWFSHHLMGFTSGLADNLAALVGIALGTLFRFWSYRKFVFTNTEPSTATHSVSELIPGSVIGTHSLAGVTALPHLSGVAPRFETSLYADEAVA
jgi:putative flippase GtrA